MEDKKITVVMSAYNHGKYVGKAIESVLNQTYQGFKFLVADDASQDDTVDVIMRYEDKIDEIHLFDVNSGHGRVYELLQLVDTPYTALINSDDYWESDKLEKQLDYMEAHPDCAACFTWCNVRDESGKLTDNQYFNVRNRTREEWMYRFMIHGNAFAHPSILIKSDVYRNLRFNSNLGQMRQTGDFCMWIKLVQKHDLHIIEEPLINFLEHSSKISTNVSAGTFENDMRYHTELSHFFCREMENMDDEFFRRSFRSLMKNPNASTHEEILCEKYFAMCKSVIYGVQDAAIDFYFDVFQDMSLYRVLNEKYGYTNKDFYKINVNTGLMTVTTTMYNEFENVKKFVNTLTLKIKSDNNAKVSRENRLREELNALEAYSEKCKELLDGQAQISDDSWEEFFKLSDDVSEIVNKRLQGNSFSRTYIEIMSDEKRKSDREKCISQCKQICDDYVSTYRVALQNSSQL